ncbi:MAG: lysine--tRNA ligase [Thermogutta sp.]|nr:lysine--tRNA ligase [Thermogutta sp.]
MVHSAKATLLISTRSLALSVSGQASGKSENELTPLEAARREKLRRLEELGIDPWGQRFDGHQGIAAIRDREGEIETIPAGDCAVGQPPELRGPRVRAAGRIMLLRRAGKIMFLDLRDWSGKIQILIGKAQVGETGWQVAQCLDLGDLLGVDGELKRTKTGELTIFAQHLTVLTKSLETPPEKWHGLTDPELRNRMRYLDLAYTDGVMQRFLQRTKIVQSIRQTLGEEGFVEVEGPTLHTVAGGAAARPFVTHHNALDMDLFLRIALELHLKRLLVGGMEKVYELGRVYRNEGISPRHNPEFTMLEAYQAYGDYQTMMDLTERLIVRAIQAAGRPLQLPWGEAVIDFTPPFARRRYDDLLREHMGVDPGDPAGLKEAAAARGLETGIKHPDVLKNELFEEFVQPRLVGPIFVMDYPASICPLTKRKPGSPEIAERFELFVQGMELANAYTELNDPDLQERLFGLQLEGLPEEESMARMDRDFLRALRYGMPPAGGLGIGIDRLVMLLTNCQSIREVILFPLYRPEA